MQTKLTLSLFIFLLLIFSPLNAQTFDGEWTCDYATYDTTPETNAIGQNCISVAAISENTFVALSRREASATLQSTNFLVGYTNADSANGRMGTHYGSRGDRQYWQTGFEIPIPMIEALDVATTGDSLIYVPNNDPDRNILVFKMGADSVEPAPYRLESGADSLWAIHVDGNGRVYVSSVKPASEGPNEILIFESVAADPNWGTTFSNTPMQTIIMPDTGDIRGITSNEDGTILYLSNYNSKEIYCYTGSPETGYTRYNGFNLEFNDPRILDDGSDTLYPGPWDLTLIKDKNILAFAADMSAIRVLSSTYYQYGKIFFANPNTGALLDTIDVSKWNFDMTGGYATRPGGTIPGNASGYTSTYNVSFDENYNIYSQSYNGWTVEKWSFSGTLPVIPNEILNVEREEGPVPDNFTLSQNYPNPFNPGTTIKFGLTNETVVELKVFDAIGQEVITLINGEVLQAGNYNIKFNASGLTSGTYIYRLKAGESVLSKKMILLK